MLTIGLSGGLNLVHDNSFQVPRAFTHDGAAALAEDGRVVAAIEEERLNRIKHSNKFPSRALRWCLAERGAAPGDVDRFAFYATEAYCNALLGRLRLMHPAMPPLPDARGLLRALLERELDAPVDPDRIVFVRHHLAHAVSAFALSGFDRSLVLAIDGYGDALSGLVATGDAARLTEIGTFAQSQSLGVLYLEVIQFLGYGSFDEYKVMGLAPYGDAAVYRPVLRPLYELLPGGGYALHLERVVPALMDRVEIRRKGEPFTRQHMDLAAALQEALEEIVGHVLRHHAEATGERSLCLAGGVAHNCTMNGKVLYSGLFERIFVQPAAHDAGCAVGAALVASEEGGRPAARVRIPHVYWGSDAGGDAAIAGELARWHTFLEVERAADVARRTAELLAEGAVVGWVQGRSEFGPRALGNRSILADPRPAANKDRINRMVKKREGYRPFAPSALEEHAGDFFELPEGAGSLPYMVFAVRVRPEKREVLGATTHVDGTARLQTVSREANPRYWALIDAFRELTGVPVVLNTSFNNNVEPIVESVEDAVVSFLTTGLDRLVVGDFVARKRTPAREDRLALRVSLPPYARLQRTRAFVGPDRMEASCQVRTTYDTAFSFPLSGALCDLLMRLEGEEGVGDLFRAGGVAPAREDALLDELHELWSQRLVRLRPPGGGPARGGAA